jgi:hypothetical protein
MITFTKPRTEGGTRIIEVKASESWDAPILLRIYRRNETKRRNADPGWGVVRSTWDTIYANPLRGLTLREAKDLAITLAAVDKALWTEAALAWWESRQYRRENP